MTSIIDALQSGSEDGKAAPYRTAPTLAVLEGGAPGGADVGAPDRGLPLQYHLLLGDAAALVVAWLPLALISGGGNVARQLVCAIAAIVASVLAMRSAGLYRSHVRAVHSRETVRVLFSSLVGAFVYAGCQWMAGGSRDGVALAAAPIAALLILTLRWRFSRWLKARQSVGRHLRPTILVGANENASALAQMLADEPELGYRVVGVVGDPASVGGPHPLEVSALRDEARRTGASWVIVVAGALHADATATVVTNAQAAGLHVQIWPAFAGLSSSRLRLAPVSGIPVMYVEPPSAPRWRKATKRAIDIFLTIMVAPVVLPVLVLAAILIKREDRGPVLYHNTVIGQGGKPITVLKLRTMVPNASQMLADLQAMNERTGGPLFKASRDPRVTRIGHVLRATSIDELPQLWNVLTGKMSLVGPRPALPHEDSQFDAELRRRYQMRPGITGLWQSEARDNPAFSAYQRLDLFYVDNWTLGLDLAILMNTAHAVSVRAIKGVLAKSANRRGSSAESEGTVPSLSVSELAGVEAGSSE